MATSDRDLVERIKGALDIVQVIEAYLPLTKRGERFVALCPFHTEKTPSFSVVPARQIFHCFGCQKSGDAFTFVMEMDKLTFPEAVRALAERAGIPLPAGERRSAADGRRSRLIEALKAAADGFAKNLKLPVGRRALEYVQRRGFNRETIEGFGIGFAPDEWRALWNQLRRAGFSDDELLGAGLVKAKEGGQPYDLLRNRVVIPIRDARGRIVGFGGRVLDDSEPKYLNSPETELFSKRTVLFGFDRARTEAAKAGFIVVEGYMDVIAAHQYGVRNVVATLGTALTKEHAQLMRPYSTRATLLFDSDAGGRRAADRGAPLLLQEGLDVAVAFLPDGVDPDEYLAAHGVDAFHAIVQERAEELLAFLIRRARERHENGAVAGTAEAVREVVQLVDPTDDDLRHALYVKRIAESFGIEERLVRRESHRAVERPAGAPAGTARSATPAAPRPAGPPQARGAALDEMFVLLGALTDQTLAKRAVEALSLTDFRDVGRRAVFRAVSALAGADGALSPAQVREEVKADIAAEQALDSVLGCEIPEGDSAELAIARILTRRVDDEVRRRISEARRSGVLRGAHDEASLDRELNDAWRHFSERRRRSKQSPGEQASDA